MGILLNQEIIEVYYWYMVTEDVAESSSFSAVFVQYSIYNPSKVGFNSVRPIAFAVDHFPGLHQIWCIISYQKADVC